MDAPSGEWLTRQLRRAEAHAHRVADLLEASMVEVLTNAADVAAAGFTARATALAAPRALTAAAPDPAATMVCLKPTPEQAAALAQAGGEPAEILHVTLCYLGKTVGPLNAVVDALRPVSLLHAALTGVVGGAGVFAKGDDGVPQIALPSVPGLVELRVAVACALAQAGIEYGRDYGYVPHMTLGYAPAGAAAPGAAIGQPLTFGELLIVRGDTEIIPLPLSGQPPVTASAAWDQPGSDPLADMRAYWAADFERGPVSAPFRYDALPAWVREPRFAAGLAQHGIAFSVEDQIRAVAEKHQPDEPAYGHAAWHAESRTVYWQDWDGTSVEDHDAAYADFLSIDGVDHVEGEAETALPEGDGWETVYSDDPWLADITGRLVLAQALPLYQWFAAGDAPPFIPPAPNEILDVEALIASITARLKPVRDAAIEATVTPVLNGVGIAYDVTNPLVAEVLAQSGSQIVEIAETTQLNVMRIVAASYREGLSIPHTAKAIQAGMTEAAPARARLIARTEMVGAVNGGSLAAVQVVSNALGVDYHKVWMTAPGAKHPRHYLYDGLNGQQRKLTGAFDVAGYPLDHPGDPQGPAGEICNCRCAMRYDEGPPSADGLV